ncbi:TIGR03617 family F420-dependent LLM class oxidoreductase [Flavisphingomonas formosensis]|uniref:TIGR03617 family F420-dependent LLM class oxidoreductase n=1 Tax=Flavisphingomonas formosensis TaxID=861534 RepID=UPI0012F97C3D|nr:TIGR03617 family F420-dependent LLM class oxidoreductase [Sphingomonas formosensis]
MKIATMITSPRHAQAEARRMEELGYDVIMTNESSHDPFILSTLVAERTERVEILTYIAVAFARNPMIAAHSAHDVQQLSGGRFTLGLGSQVKAHVERRFSMPWSHAAPRMRDFVGALHAIWDCWYEGRPLEYRGSFYRHDLTSPIFIPERGDHPRPHIGLAAVGPEMHRVAAQSADSLLCHSFTTPKYLREVTLPAIARATAERRRPESALRLVGMPFIATGETEEELGRAVAGVRKTIAFYASTPAYRAVLEVHGLEAAQPELLRLFKLGRWKEMGELVDDGFVDTFAVVGDAARCARSLHERFAGIFDLIGGYAGSGPGMPEAVMQELRKLQTA